MKECNGMKVLSSGNRTRQPVKENGSLRNHGNALNVVIACPVANANSVLNVSNNFFGSCFYLYLFNQILNLRI